METTAQNNIVDTTFHFGVNVQPRAMKDERGIEFWLFELSNEEVDRHGSIFRMSGARIKDYNEDPIVTFGHPNFDTTDPDDCIGTGPVYIENGKLYGKFYPELGDTPDKTKKVLNKLREGTIKSCSIVADIIDYHKGSATKGEPDNILIYDEWELLSWGIVLKGSNSKAKARSAEKVRAFRSLLPDSTPPVQAEEIKETVQPDDDGDLALLSELNVTIARSAQIRLTSYGDKVAKTI